MILILNLFYEFVLNYYDYEPYYGSLKGSEQTLLEGSGNDIDQASLMLALLRRNNIPARYVHGIVEIPIEQARNLVGVEDPALVASVFIKHGVPVDDMIQEGGAITAIRVQHTWTRVFLEYLPYMGRVNGPYPVRSRILRARAKL